MRKPFIWTSIATYIAIFVWLLLLCSLVNREEESINTPGVCLHLILLLAIGIPLPFFICFHFAPFFAQLCKQSRPRTLLLICGFHGAIALGLFIVYRYIHAGMPGWVVILIIPFYFLVLLTPPSFIGHMTYFLLSRNAKIDQENDQSQPL